MIKLAAGFLLAFCAALLGQNKPAPKFEVASVKAADPDAPGGMIRFPNGTFEATGITVRNCITLAYEIQGFQLAGGPSWIDDQRYDIRAKMPAAEVLAPGDPARFTQMRAALQALLADRFQLAVRRETKVVPAYVLVAAKGGVKLKEAAKRGAISMSRGKLKAEGMSIDTLVRTLAGNLGSPVVDMTGLKGDYDLTLEWTPDDVQSPGKSDSESVEPASGLSIFAALQEQLGLKLEKQKAPVEMIVIDRIEKPGEN